MTVCDRCKKKIKNETEIEEFKYSVYDDNNSTWLDLCESCQKELNVILELYLADNKFYLSNIKDSTRDNGFDEIFWQRLYNNWIE